MTTITKEFTFDCAHQLLNHRGLCRNIHGHTYKLQIEIAHKMGGQAGRTNPSEGMLIDFSDLKSEVKRLIIDKFDHAFIADGDEPILEKLQELDYKVHIMGRRPTAENMAEYIYNILVDEAQIPCKISKVRIWETPTSFAEYSE